MAVWHRVDFGFRLDKECHGCTRAHKLNDPVGVNVKVAPQFSDKCPDRVEEKK
jgi:hypothetical protein